MDFIQTILEKAKSNKKRVILTETGDIRVLKAAEIAMEENIADIILIGREEEITKKSSILKKITIINPETSSLTSTYIEKLVTLRKEKGMTKIQAEKLLLEDYMYFACMLVLDNKADGIVSGSCHSSRDTLRPSLQLMKAESNEKVSSFFLMEVPDCSYGENGIFVFADCGLQQNPTSMELADIAIQSAKTFEQLVETTPYVALLSHSTKESAKHPNIEKVVEATKLANEKNSNYLIDGELQLDAAIIPEIAKIKCPNSEVAGKANVLIFPDLDSGNIGYKLVERLAHAKAYGPLTQGLSYPVNDLSRGCSVEDIVGVIAITVVQASRKS